MYISVRILGFSYPLQQQTFFFQFIINCQIQISGFKPMPRFTTFNCHNYRSEKVRQKIRSQDKEEQCTRRQEARVLNLSNSTSVTSQTGLASSPTSVSWSLLSLTSLPLTNPQQGWQALTSEPPPHTGYSQVAGIHLP